MDTLFSALDIAFDRRKLFLAFLLGLVGALCVLFFTSLSVGLGEAGSTGTGIVFLIIDIIILLATIGLVFGGVGRLVAIQIEEHRQPKLSEGLRFLGQRFVPLAFGFVAVALAALIFGALVNWFVSLVYGLPGLGPTLTGLATVPLFVFNLILWLLLLNSLLVPCIIAVENCGLVAAGRRLIDLATSKGGRLIAYELLILMSLLMLAGIIAFVMGPPLGATNFASGNAPSLISFVAGPHAPSVPDLGNFGTSMQAWSGAASSSSNGAAQIGSVLSIGSNIVIALATVCYLIVYAVVSLTLVYRGVSRSAV